MAKSTYIENLDFAEIVSATRNQRHLSQTELAEILGVSPRTVQNWEAGAYPWPKHRRAILEWANGTVAA